MIHTGSYRLLHELPMFSSVYYSAYTHKILRIKESTNPDQICLEISLVSEYPQKLNQLSRIFEEPFGPPHSSQRFCISPLVQTEYLSNLFCQFYFCTGKLEIRLLGCQEILETVPGRTRNVPVQLPLGTSEARGTWIRGSTKGYSNKSSNKYIIKPDDLSRKFLE